MMNPALDQIEQQRKKWEASVNQGDVDGYMSCIEDEAVWVAPNLLPMVGRQAIKKWLEPFFQQFDYDFTTSDHQIQASGGWACEQACFFSKMVPKNTGDSMLHQGQYILFWRENAEGLWLMNRYAIVADLGQA